MPHRGHQVVGPVAVEVDRPLPLQHLDERLQGEVAVRPSSPASRLRLVLAGLDELLALQRGDLHARERGLLLVPAVALRVLAVGHLQAAEDLGAVRQLAGDAHLLDGAAAELDVERLPADDVAGAGHDVGGGDAAGQWPCGCRGRPGRWRRGPAAPGWTGPLISLPSAWAGTRRPAIDADVRVRVHQAGDDDGALQVDDLGPVRQVRRSASSAADGRDLAVRHDQHAVRDRLVGRRRCRSWRCVKTTRRRVGRRRPGAGDRPR